MSTTAVATPCTPEAIYERCGCDPADSAYPAEHYVIDGVGWTCDRGLVYLVCSSCCSGTANTAVCETTHQHGIGRPWCPAQMSTPDTANAAYRPHAGQLVLQ